MTGLDISKRRGGAMVAVLQTLAIIAGRAATRMPAQREGHLGMNTPPIVSSEAWEAARQKMLAKEKAAMDALTAEGRMSWMAAENHLRNFPPGSLPDQTEVPEQPAVSADTTADTQAGEMAQAGSRGAYEFEGPDGKVSPTALENHSRALSRFLIVFCGGVAATLAWWSYGDSARRMIASSYPQLRSLAPPRAVTAPKAPDMIVPDPNQLDATLHEPHTMPQSPDRIVAGEELTHNTNQTTTSVDQAPSVQADSIPLERGGDGAAMRHFTMTVMALTAFGALVVAARAEYGGGAPFRNGDQCFKYSGALTDGVMKDGRFGYWGACPQRANTSKATAPAPRPRVRRSRAASR
jgi:hypothetical protein